MRTILQLMLFVTTSCFALPTQELLPDTNPIYYDKSAIGEIISILHANYDYSKTTQKPLIEIKNMLHKEANTLSEAVIDKVIKTLACAREYNVEHNNILTIIDYSLPSSEKRLWVFSINDMKLLFHTYVSHGIKSGELLSMYFSNKYNSKASSIGVYKTEKAYRGREGLSLRLDGLERSFNDNASNRAVVMHGGWYVEENFIKKYGRAGRSWGCPAVPLNLRDDIINTIKDNSLFVVYYPSDSWFVKSKFLTCNIPYSAKQWVKTEPDSTMIALDNEGREEVLFAQTGRSINREDSEPIVAMTADNYANIFHTQAPLKRMLRRQINKEEYIALSNTEFNSLVTNNTMAKSESENSLRLVYFVIPVVKMQRGYYVTEMHLVNLGKIKEVKFNTSNQTPQHKSYTVYFEEKPAVNLRATNRFIRWLGL